MAASRHKVMEHKENSLLDALNKIQEQSLGEQKKEIVDIVTFCEDPDYLNLPGNNFHLWMSQKVILKTFYMGTRGNENLKLTKEEWDWLYEQEKIYEIDGIKYEKNISDVIRKLKEKEREQAKALAEGDTKTYQKYNFTELNLVLGRRGSKTIMASVITSYEVYKLLVIGDGDPHKFYGLPYDDVISVINVALSQQQAGKLFGEIQNRLRGSTFFQGRVAKETASEIRLYTDKDLEKREKGSIIAVQGSISILCGHSNPDSLRGMSTILILFDEMAFLDETGKVNGKKFYETLRPSRLKFLKHGDGRLVEISSPNTESGMFYEIHKSSKTTHQILSYQLPTWDSNPDVDYDDADLVQDRERSLESFAVEYGAQWARSGKYGPYFEEGLIDRCVRTDIEPHMKPQPVVNYYLHVDPANGGDRYAAVLVAKKPYVNTLGHRRIRVELANTWVFPPQPGVGLVFNEIDRALLHICRIYRPVIVTFDDFQSAHSLQFLRSNGVHCVKTNFSRGYKNKIYQNLKDMMSYHPEPELWLYDDPHGIISELRGIRYRPTLRGVSLSIDKDSPVPYDDLVDCLCGAVAMASETTKMSLPAPVVVHTGFL